MYILPFMPPLNIIVINLPLWRICIGATANHIKATQVKLILSGDSPDCGATRLEANQGKSRLVSDVHRYVQLETLYVQRII
jgi:hypothetical protein